MPYTHIYDDTETDMHILPLVEDGEDLYIQEGHTQDEDCFCSPEVQYSEESDTYLIVHNYIQ